MARIPTRQCVFIARNLPKHFFREATMKYQAIIAGTVGN